MSGLVPVNSDPSPASVEIARLLMLVGQGDRDAEALLFETLYHDLRRLAARFLQGESPGQTLSPTVLVNEVYLRIFGAAPPNLKDRHHFFALSSRVMRRLLVDRARSRGTLKRFGGKETTLTEFIVATEEHPDQLLAVDQALQRLSAFAPRAAKVVEMRFFGGMENTEIAGVLDTSEKTIQRDWSMSKAWLFKELVTLSPNANNF